MGLFLIFGVGIHFWLTVVALGAAITSAIRCGTVPLYWLIAVASMVVLPAAVLFTENTAIHPNDGWLGALFKTAFSGVSVVILVGGLLSGALAKAKHEVARLSSGISWGFAALVVVQLIRVAVA
jgi:hypothetical protein